MADTLHALDGGGDAKPSPELASAVEQFETDASARDSLVIDGRFEILGRIGMGTSGSVYRAFDRTLDRHVAIKVLAPCEPLAAAREAHLLARIGHRNVVAIHDYGIGPGFRYLVLELLVGRDLRRWLSERPAVDEIVTRFVEAGRGLAAAHRAGLVHRDFKPSNLIVTLDGRAVVIDFSLARNLDTLDDASAPASQPPAKPSRGSGSGSLAYLAPEHLALELGDERSDQFSFCVMFWEALTGQNPFAGDDPTLRYQAIARGPGELVAEVPEHLVRALRRGLSRSPGARFSSMDELLDAIEHPPIRAPKRRRRSLLSALLVAATFALGWGVAPDPVIDHAVSSESFNPKSAAAFILLDAANRKLALGHTSPAKDAFDAATKLIMDLDATDPRYCQFGGEVENFADGLLAANDLQRGRVLYARAIKFAKDCKRPRDYMEQLEGKKRSSRESFMALALAHEHEQCLPPIPEYSNESGLAFELEPSFQWTDAP